MVGNAEKEIEIMWPFAIAIGAVVAIAAAIGSAKKTVLEENFERLSRLLDDGRALSVAVIGQAGAGKSSLIDTVTDGKSQPRPKTGQGTDATDWSRDIKVELFNRYQDVRFIDTPGYGTATHSTKSYLEYLPIRKIDKIIFVIKGKIREDDEKMFKKIAQDIKERRNLIIVRAYAENMTEAEKKEILADINTRLICGRNNISVVFYSSRYGYGVDAVKRFVGGWN